MVEFKLVIGDCSFVLWFIMGIGGVINLVVLE